MRTATEKVIDAEIKNSERRHELIARSLCQEQTEFFLVSLRNSLLTVPARISA
jgi:hypothetical protein